MKDKLLPLGATIIERDTTLPTDEARHELAQQLAEKGGSNLLIQCVLGENPVDFSERTGLSLTI